MYFAALDQLVANFARHVGRNREPDTDVATRWRQDLRVDPDQFAARVDERAARVPRLMAASVCRKSSKLPSLNPVRRPLALMMPEVTVWPTPSGLPTASTTSPTRTLSESPSGRTVILAASDLQNGKSLGGIAADRAWPDASCPRSLDLDVLGAIDHVVVREDVAVFRHDNAGAQPALHLSEAEAACRTRRAEELAKHRIVEKWETAAARGHGARNGSLRRRAQHGPRCQRKIAGRRAT